MNAKEELAEWLLDHGIDEAEVNALKDELKDYHCFLFLEILEQLLPED